MAYLGSSPSNGFFTRQIITGDGSETTFTLNHTVASESSLIVSNNAVVLEPQHGYDLALGGTKIVFASAPANNVRTYIHYLGQGISQVFGDLNGAALILDDDGDTYIRASTDDVIDFRIGGTNRTALKATGFHNLDSIKFIAGTGDDMQMYHDGTNSYLTNSTGCFKNCNRNIWYCNHTWSHDF